jgi:hypothetical protein
MRVFQQYFHIHQDEQQKVCRKLMETFQQPCELFIVLYNVYFCFPNLETLYLDYVIVARVPSCHTTRIPTIYSTQHRKNVCILCITSYSVKYLAFDIEQQLNVKI